MNVELIKRFDKDLDKVKDISVLEKVYEIISEVEKASNILEINHIKKMVGFKTYYRIRVMGYRIGVDYKEGVVTFLRCLPRKDIYRYFP